jgi:hypothetical protein
MTGIGLGFSKLKNAAKAGRDAARAALGQLSGQCHSCLVFATVGYPQQDLLSAIYRELGPVPMVGCSGEGIIGPGIADESNHSVLVLAMSDQRIRLTTAGYPDVSDSRAAAQHIGGVLARAMPDDARFILLFPGGLNLVADELLSELERHLPGSLPCVGGASGENWFRNKTFQYHDWQVYEEGISSALVSGNFKLATTVTHGCLPIGTELEITRVQGNRLYEIDGRPVMDVMAEYVGQDIWSDFGKVAVHFCLGEPLEKEVSEEYDSLIIRFIPKHHPEDKSVSLPVRMREGDRVWMTRRDQDKMFEAAKRGIEKLKAALKGSDPFLGLHFDCAGRGRVVLSEEDKMGLIDAFQKGIAPGTPWAGFYTYGEFCPVAGKNRYHNYTAALALLY